MSTPMLQRFDGTTIEEALAAAVAATGQEVDVVEAQRVRSGGVLGFFAKERYEVSVTPRVGTARVLADAQHADRFDAVLRAMVDRVDHAEEVQHDEHVAGHAGSAWWTEADFVVEGLDGELVIGPPEDTMAPEYTADAPAEAVSPAAVAVDLTGGAPIDVRSAGSPWCRLRLLELGVPASIVSLLPEATPANELEWLTALTAAIESTRIRAQLTTPAGSECVVNGTGAPSALTILRAVEIGLTPGRLTVGGRTVEATPLELSLAIRACVLESA